MKLSKMLYLTCCCWSAVVLRQAAAAWSGSSSQPLGLPEEDRLLEDPPDEVLLERTTDGVVSRQQAPAEPFAGASLMQISVKSPVSLALSPSEVADIFRELEDEFDEPKVMLQSETEESALLAQLTR